MITSNNNEIDKNAVYIVRDWLAQLWLLAIIFGLPILLSYVFDEGYWQTEEGGLLYLGVMGLSAVLFIRFIVVSLGVVIKPAENTITIYGGGISPNSLLDYLNPFFLAQYFMRFTYPLSELTMGNISAEIDDKGKVTSHILELRGSFGAVGVKFYSKAKCEECLALLAQINNMGYPISNR